MDKVRDRFAFPDMGEQRELWLHSAADDDLVGKVAAALDAGPGFVVVAGIPVSPEALDAAERKALGIAMTFGQPLWQDDLGSLTWLVRDTGDRPLKDDSFIDLRRQGKVSQSSQALAFHTDDSSGWFGQDIDVMGMLMVEDDRHGGDTLLLDSRSVFEAFMAECPALLVKLCVPLPFLRNGGSLPGQSELVWLPMFSWQRAQFRARLNPRRVRASIQAGAAVDSETLEALDVLEELMARWEYQLRLHLEPGELILVDERRGAHGRTAFTSSRRSLVRVWLRRPPPQTRCYSWSVDMS